MKKIVMLGVCAALMLPVPGSIVKAIADEVAAWTLEKALEQIDDATEDIEGVTAEAKFTDIRSGESTLDLTGKFYLDMKGKMRVELEAEKPKTFLCNDSKLYMYEAAEQLVQEYKLKKHPEKLAQYALLGFSQTGRDLEYDYLVSLLEETSLDDNKVLVLELTPKSSSTRRDVSKIQLWIDQANWLPIQQKIFHSSADTHLTVRYNNVARNDSLDKDLFKADWPKGTEKIKR